MIRRTFFGIVWCVVGYFGACAVVGATAGAISGIQAPVNQDPATAAVVGAQVGARAVAALRPYLFFGAVVLAALGGSFGVLPGTRSKPAAKDDD